MKNFVTIGFSAVKHDYDCEQFFQIEKIHVYGWVNSLQNNKNK
mgnify:CR=1 FL=1